MNLTPYHAVFIARIDKLEISGATFEKLKNAISTDEMRRLNYETDANKLIPKDVVSAWIIKKGF